MKLLDFTGASPCANEGLKTYVLGSYFVSFADMIHESAHWMEADGGPQPNLYLRDFRIHNNISVEFRNVLVLALLIHQNRLQLLTSERRKELGGDWNTGEAFGAYDCNARVISVDPSMRPFDLGATLQHEMDHFMRDQFFTAQGILEYFTPETYLDIVKARALPSPDKVDWEAYLAMDESVASIEASVMQREQINDQGGVWEFSKRFSNKDYVKIYGLYAADRDFNFRVSNGPMESLFNMGSFHDPVRDLEGTNWQPSVQFQIQDGEARNKPAAILGIFDLVHSSYFAGAGLSDEIKSVLGRQQPIELDPLNEDFLNFANDLPAYTFETKDTRVLLMHNAISAVAASVTKVSSGCQLY